MKQGQKRVYSSDEDSDDVFQATRPTGPPGLSNLVDSRRGSISAAPITQKELDKPALKFEKTEEEKARLRTYLKEIWLTARWVFWFVCLCIKLVHLSTILT